MSRIISVIIFIVLVVLLLLFFRQCSPNSSLIETQKLNDNSGTVSEGVINRTDNALSSPKIDIPKLSDEEKAEEIRQALEETMNKSVLDAISKKESAEQQASNKSTKPLATESNSNEITQVNKTKAVDPINAITVQAEKAVVEEKNQKAESVDGKEVSDAAINQAAVESDDVKTTDISAKIVVDEGEEDQSVLGNKEISDRTKEQTPEQAVAIAAKQALELQEEKAETQQAISGSLGTDEKSDVSREKEPDKEDSKPINKLANKTEKTSKDSEIMIILQGVNFKYGSTKLTDDSSKQLDRMVSRFKQKKELKVEVAGYSDNIGNPKVNTYISKLRAEAVKEYFVTHGIESNRLIAKGYGAKSPIADNSTVEGRNSNRRVELHIK